MQISPQVFGRAKKLRRDALEELFAEVYPAVMRIARGLSGREDVAEGVVRFVMTRSVAMVPRWRDETVAERWFLHHTVLTVRRAAVRRWVKRGLRPHRLRRLIFAVVGLIVIVVMLWSAWKWERG